MALETLICTVCETEWTRESTRGRKPKLCPDCKEDPAQVKIAKVQTEEQKRAAAKKRIDDLEINLKANGSHLSEPRPRRSYSIAEIEERLAHVEEQITELFGIHRPDESAQVDPGDRGPEKVSSGSAPVRRSSKKPTPAPRKRTRSNA